MITTAFQLLVLMLVFSIIEAHWPALHNRRWWRRPLLVDICSWLIHPLSVSAGIALAIGCNDTLLLNIGFTVAPLRTSMAALPAFVQIILAVLIADFLWYWLHRAYHHFSLLWAFHVVHHSSEELDWLSTSRLHPVGQMFNHAIVAGVLLLVGLPARCVIAANVVIGAAAVLVHANVRWTYGPLQHVFVSPMFHHWHHARAENGAQAEAAGNFGALFSFWDRLFGTWLLPSNRPVRFGVDDAPASTLSSLFLHPFRVCLHSLWRKRDKESGEGIHPKPSHRSQPFFEPKG
jgi:sterol desaturase/sphingolipid hydroxylase (fatty acid hydroxylase superfamily)